MNGVSRFERLAHGVGTRGAGDVEQPEEERVTPLELFFDLVFVLAITQVTAQMADDLSWSGLAKGMLILAWLWWAWAAYAWLTNTIDPDAAAARLTVFISMAAMLVVALAVPGVWSDDAVVFGFAYLLVRFLWAVLFWLGAREAGDRDLMRAVRGLTPYALVAPAIMVVGCFLDESVRPWVFLGALLLDMAGPYVQPSFGWKVHAEHFAERHGLIVIIALGESIVALGVGAENPKIDISVITTATLGVVVAATMWWAYFDVVALVAKTKLAEATGEAQAKLARDSYTMLHLPMVAGIVLLALGVKKVIAHDDEPLPVEAAAALCGGIAIYLLGHIGMRLRNVRSLNKQRLLVTVLLLAFIPVAAEIDALAALAIVSALMVTLVGYESIRFAQRRAEIRAMG